jgi:hypothetical protein
MILGGGTIVTSGIYLFKSFGAREKDVEVIINEENEKNQILLNANKLTLSFKTSDGRNKDILT